MARASTKTTVYEIRSRETGETFFVAERAVIKFQKIAGRVVRSNLRPQIADKTGKTFERSGGMLMRCLQSGEVFQIVEQAPSIRKVSAS